jgi:hypothetical protein
MPLPAQESEPPGLFGLGVCFTVVLIICILAVIAAYLYSIGYIEISF